METKDYELVPENFTFTGFTFVMVKRERNIAIYEQRLTKSNRLISYEVVILKEQQASVTIMGGKEIQRAHKEVYPSTGQWGRLGWTYNKLASAESKFDRLLNPTDKLHLDRFTE